MAASPALAMTGSCSSATKGWKLKVIKLKHSTLFSVSFTRTMSPMKGHAQLICSLGSPKGSKKAHISSATDDAALVQGCAEAKSSEERPA